MAHVGGGHGHGHWGGHERKFWVELTIAILLGASAIAVATAAYWAHQKDRTAIANFNHGVKSVNQASEAYLEGTQGFVQDQALFLEYAKAALKDDLELAGYLRETLMSDDLVAALNWWEKQPSDKYASPFVDANPDYHPISFEQGAKYDEEAQHHFEIAEKADKKGNRYDFVEVILASVFFLLGIGGIVRRDSIQLGFLGIGSVLFVLAIVQLARVRWG